MEKLLTANEARALTAKAHNSLVENYTSVINQTIIEEAKQNRRCAIIGDEGLTYLQKTVLIEALKALGFKADIVPAGLRIDW